MRIFIVREYYLNNKSIILVQRKFKKEFNCRTAPCFNMISNLIKKFEETGSALDDLSGNVGRPATPITLENIEKVRKIMEKSPNKSTRKGAPLASISNSSFWRILRTEPNLFPYKIQIKQRLSPGNAAKRFEFADILLPMISNEELDPKQVWFSDEAQFYLDGYVNKQNWRFWGNQNPHIVHQRALHPRRTTVWCALSSSGIIGPVFIHENINSELYINVLNRNFIPALQGMGVNMSETWFMQDGARPHRTQSVLELLNEHFGEKIISLDSFRLVGEGIDWAPYSPDLNPCDYFLWGYLKEKVYAHNPQSLEELENIIETEILNIPNTVLNDVIDNFQVRLQHIHRENGWHIEHILS